jgi:hypothetical protein
MDNELFNNDNVVLEIILDDSNDKSDHVSTRHRRGGLKHGEKPHKQDQMYVCERE